MIRVNKVPQWQTAQYMSEFLDIHVSTLSKDRQAVYRTWLQRFISYCCKAWECDANEIDFATCTFILIEDRTFPQQITYQFVKYFIATIKSTRSQYDAETVLRTYFKVLESRGFIQTNPVPKVPHPERNVPNKQGLSVHEINRFTEVLKNWPMPDRAAISLQLAAGLRVGELCSLRVEDLDMNESEEWCIYVRNEVLKNRTEYRSPLAYIPDTMGQYNDWRKTQITNSGYLFIDENGQPLTKKRLNKHIAKIGGMAGCSRRVTSHDMRRAFATLLSRNRIGDALHQMLRNSERVSWGYVINPTRKDIEQALEKLPCVQLAESFALKTFSK